MIIIIIKMLVGDRTRNNQNKMSNLTVSGGIFSKHVYIKINIDHRFPDLINHRDACTITPWNGVQTRKYPKNLFSYFGVISDAFFYIFYIFFFFFVRPTNNTARCNKTFRFEQLFKTAKTIYHPGRSLRT